jgi:RNA polymerase sigma-70 factor (ECF subfamily)
VAEAFIALWNTRRQIYSDTHIRNFLYVTVRNKAINLIAAKRRHKNLLENFGEIQPSTDESLSADLVEAELLYLLLQAVKTLPTECRRIFDLSYGREMSSVEIARFLDIAPATVRSQKRRAIELIRQWIEKNASSGLVIGTLIAAGYFFENFYRFFAH